MIIEGLLATTNEGGALNLAPMGPRVSENFQTLLFRPFESSQSLAHLRRTRCGVFHLTDDVLLLAKAAIHRLDPPPQAIPTPSERTFRLVDCCRWFEFEVSEIRETPPRIELECRVVEEGFVRHWTGFNRAKHAVLEAAILATRVGILPQSEIDAEMTRLETIVGKTAGPAEFEAFTLLKEHVRSESEPKDLA